MYNRFGPRIAKKIRSPWTADFAYVVLIPAQFLAAVVIKIAAILNLENAPPQTFKFLKS
jgi:hypothetical protein